jgi:hypothetical protein
LPLRNAALFDGNSIYALSGKDVNEKHARRGMPKVLFLKIGNVMPHSDGNAIHQSDMNAFAQR